MRNNRKNNDSSSEEENSPKISSRNRQTRNAKQSSSYERNNYSKWNENYSKGKKNYLKREENIHEKDETIISLNRRSSLKRNRNQQERGDDDHNSLDRNNSNRRGSTHRDTLSQDNNSKFSETSTSAEWVETFDSNLLANQFCCTYCKMTFSRQIHLSKHLKNNCLKNPVAKCNSDLISNPYVCRTCGLRFKMQKFLNYHVRHVCGRTVVCDICHAELKGSTVSGKHKRICMQKQRKKSLQSKTENENQSTFSNLSSNLSNEIECDSD